jgi:hypothetical protein
MFGWICWWFHGKHHKRWMSFGGLHVSCEKCGRCWEPFWTHT